MLLPFALFVVSLATLLAAQVHKSWPDRKRTYPLMTVALFFLGAAVLAAIVALANHFYVKSQLEGLADALGLRRELAWALTLFVSGALSYFVAKSLSWRSTDRRTGYLGVSALVALYFLIHYGGTYGDHFDPEGNSRTCMAWDESGVRHYPSQQVDRPTGRPCILVTPENRDELAPLLDRRDATPRPKTEGPYFTSRSYASGPVPLAWFSRAETGAIELWDAPGYHPETGVKLRLITPELMQERQRPLAMPWPPARPPGGDATTAGVRQQADAVTEAPRVKNSAQALRDRYLRASVTATQRDDRRPRWVLLAWSADGRFDPHVGNQIARVARNAGLTAPSSLFTESFVQDGTADRVLRGDADVLAQMGLSGVVDFIVLARVEERRLPDRGPETLKAVDYELQAQVLRVGDLSRSSPVRIAEGAAGYDYEIAAQRARDAALAEPSAALTYMLKDFVK